MMARRAVHHLLDGLSPGDRLDLDDIDPEYRDEFLLEFEGFGYVLSPEGIVGDWAVCTDCKGDGLDKRAEECSLCDGYGNTADYGSGKVPYRT